MWTRARAIAYLNETFRTLEAQTDLSPDNALVTQRLHDLVATLQAWQRRGFGDTLAQEPDLADARAGLPELCARAECMMEKWWCRKALASAAPWRVLSDFWYLANYRSLCCAETALAGQQALREAVFLGCGALPLTAILLAVEDENARLTCVDADGEACDLAAALVGALGLPSRIAIDHSRAEDHPIPPAATVICASLLEAPGLYAHLAARGAARLLIRDVEGVYRWLYRPAPHPGPAFSEAARTAQSPERINITRHFDAMVQVRPRAALAAGIGSP